MGFLCLADEHDFVIFEGLLFTLTTKNAVSLVEELNAWVENGASLQIRENRALDESCNVSTIETCSGVSTSPTESSTATPSSTEARGAASPPLLAGTAVGGVIIGLLLTAISILILYIVWKQ